MFAESLVQMIVFEYYKGEMLKEIMSEHLLSSLLIALSRVFRETMNQDSSIELGNRNISDIIQYIIDRNGVISLKDLAAHFHYHEMYLSRLIKKYAGANFSDILQNIRFRKAASMLRDTDISLAQIMDEVGYTNRSWFNNKFRGYYKQSPLEYRKYFKTE